MPVFCHPSFPPGLQFNLLPQLSLCLGNRSAALFRLGLFSAASEDVSEALEAGGHPKPEKLIQRKERCLREMEKGGDDPLLVPGASRNPRPKKNETANPICPALDAAVEIQYDKDRGR